MDVLSGTLNPTVGAQFTNNTGSTVTSLDVSYMGEMWRAGVTSRNAADRLDFQLSSDATSLTTGTWVDYNSLDFNSPNIERDGRCVERQLGEQPDCGEPLDHGFEHPGRRVVLDSLVGLRHRVVG